MLPFCSLKISSWCNVWKQISDPFGWAQSQVFWITNRRKWVCVKKWRRIKPKVCEERWRFVSTKWAATKVLTTTRKGKFVGRSCWQWWSPWFDQSASIASALAERCRCSFRQQFVKHTLWTFHILNVRKNWLVSADWNLTFYGKENGHNFSFNPLLPSSV